MPENNRKMQTDISELENGQLAEQQLPSDFTLVVLAGGASSHRGRDCAGSNFRSGSTWRSGELFSKGKDRKMPGAGGRYAAGTCGRTSKSVEVRNGKSRPTGDYAVS